MRTKKLSIAIAGVILTSWAVSPSAAQVNSTWTNDGGNSVWTSGDNWDHDVPAAEGNWPKNGNGGFNFNAQILLVANVALNQEVELNGLSVLGFNRFINGGSQLTVTGLSTFEGLAGFAGGGGIFEATGGVQVNSGTFRVDGWTVNTSGVSMGSNTTLSLLNGGRVNLAGTLQFTSDGSISGQASTLLELTNGAIERAGGATVSSLTVPVNVFSGTLRSNSGELRFGPVFGIPAGQPVITITDATLQADGGGLVRFDNLTVAVDESMTIDTADGSIDLKDANVQLGGTITGNGVLTLSGNNALLAGGGSINVGGNALILSGFVHNGGTIASATNLGRYRWRSGAIEGGTFINQVSTDTAFAVEQNGTRLVSMGTFLNETTFHHQTGTITLGAEGFVENTGTWIMGTVIGLSNPSLVLQTPNDPSPLFNNTGEFQSSGNIDSVATVHVPFSNTGLVRSVGGRLVFKPGTVAQYDYTMGELSGGQWIAENDGQIFFEGITELRIVDGAVVGVDGPDADFDPLKFLSQNSGQVNITGGKEQTVTPATGTVVSSGTISVEGEGSGLSVDGSVSSSGSITVSKGYLTTVEDIEFEFGNGTPAFLIDASLQSTRAILQGGPADTTDVYLLDGTTLQATESVEVNGGTLHGSNSTIVTPFVENANGAISAESPGLFTIDGNYVQQSGGTLQCTLAGTSPGMDYGQLVVTSECNLAGTVDVEFEEGFTPAAGQQFVVVTAGLMRGTLPTVDSPIELDVRMENDSLILSVPQAPGDIDGDGDVDLADFALFSQCLSGPAAGLPPGCEAADLDGDNDVDQADFASLMNALTQN